MIGNLLNLEKKIGIKFHNKKNLLKSLTHKSFDTSNNNEKLEFLGDRVLGLVISKKLFELYPDDTEGRLDKKLAFLVNKNRCCEIGKKINLDKFIITSTSNKKENNIVDKIISDSCEALIGAIFLDHGFIVVEKFINRLWKKHLQKSIQLQIDAKTKLQEYSLKKYKSLPIYKFLSNTGPKHKPLFKIAVKIQNSKFISATGYSKKDAELKAANLFLKKIGL
jgi:ribonuclease-3|tara:strand:- start:502 stop:1167 length:666 start_codon:yes stop_codon:yes gene_type:complete